MDNNQRIQEEERDKKIICHLFLLRSLMISKLLEIFL
jgi:hypothetical protein